MKDQRQLIVALTGPDGAGKSTVSERLLSHFNQPGKITVRHVTIWDYLELGHRLTSKAQVLAHLTTLNCGERLAFMAEMLSAGLEEAKKSDARVLIVNGYWQKYAAGEMGYGATLSQALAFGALFPPADLIFCLDLDPQIAWTRRGQASRYEQGLLCAAQQDAHDAGTEERFVSFQKQVAKHWRSIETAQASEVAVGPWQHLSAEQSPEQLTLVIARAIDRAAQGQHMDSEDNRANQAHVLVVNSFSNGGRGASRLGQLLSTPFARDCGLAEAARFDTSTVAEAEVKESLGAWLTSQMKAGARNIVAAGGDGTVNLTLNALVTARDGLGLEPTAVRFGALGLGSSNDFQKPFGADGRAKIAGVHCRLDFNRARFHDLGLVTTNGTVPAEQRYFIVNSSIGICADAALDFTQAKGLYKWLKRVFTNAAIFFAGLKQIFLFKNVAVQVAIDNQPAESMRIANLGMVKNIHFAGDMRYDVPQPSDDGLLGVHIAGDMSKWQLIRMLLALGNGRFSGFRHTRSLQARRIETRSSQPFSVEADGEVQKSTHVVIEALKQRLLVCP